MPNTEIKYEILKTIGIVSETAKGWKKELNLVKWNDRDPKYDLRDWSPDRSKMGKGVTLTSDEIKKLASLIQSI